MATYRAVYGVLNALEEFLKQRLPGDLANGPGNAKVQIVGSKDLDEGNLGTVLALYLHRVSIDQTNRNRYIKPPPGSRRRAVPELPLQLHLLLIAFADSPETEVNLLGWGMQQLASYPTIGIERLDADTLDWGTTDTVQIVEDELSTEDMMRIWDGLTPSYRLTAPYLIKTVRVAPDRPSEAADPVISRIFNYRDRSIEEEPA